MTEKKIRKKKNPFKQGAITPMYIAESIEHHQHKTGIGAHEIFLGQVRADKIGESEVVAIDYSAYEEMAINELDVIREEIFAKYELSCMHIYHSLGRVEVGQICLF
ncbi:MAG: molybdenum cofactor biosynthesis protein MoaE, partial [Bacteroidia bacterium]